MKAKIYRFLVLLIIPVTYYVIVSGFHRAGGTTEELKITSPPSVSVPKDFVNFILTNDYGDYCTNSGANWYMEKHIDRFGPEQYSGELNFNGVQIYDKDSGTCALGWFDAGWEAGQQSKMNSLVDMAHNYHLKAIYQRSNIANLCFAQRLVYEVYSGGSTTVNDGFCYQTCRGHYEVEQDGTTAIHACTNPQQCNEENWDGMPQNICENIYENYQHSDLPDFQIRDVWEWHLKPRMKIRQEDFNDSNKQALPVVTIKVYCFGDPDNPIAEKTIRVRNFRDQNDEYDGRYIDIYNFFGEIPSVDLWIPGDKTNGLNKGWNDIWWEWDDPNSPNYCHVDFKIHWEGNVDVWFDKLTVDDYRAYILFSPAPNNYDQFIDQELSAFCGPTSHPIDIFFADETTYSNIPCIKYVTDYVRDNSPGTRICCATTNFLNVHGLKNDDLRFRPFLEAVHPDYFQQDVHEFWGGSDQQSHWGNCIPEDVFSTLNSQVPDWWEVSAPDYNDWLQNEVLGDKYSSGNSSRWQGSYVYQMHLARTQANQYSPGTRYIAQPQIHAWLDFVPPDGKFYSGLREPLNEEIQVQAMIALAHGADGLCWFWYNSFIHDKSSASNLRPYYQNMSGSEMNPLATKVYDAGMLEFDNYTRREHNLYDQNKWKDVKDMNAKILSWKPTLDVITWDEGYSVHSEGANYEYIDDIKSYYREPMSLQFINQDQVKYWEIGFFTDDSNSKYFMMVNRRCIPEITIGEGDIRQLMIKFDAAQLSYRNWVITDLYSGKKVSFDKYNQVPGGYVSLGGAEGDPGYFNPGEGKLFKLEPIMKSGGILIANEDVPSGEEFTCEDTVWTNGYNLTIEDNVTINFSDSAKFVVRGGTFQMGNAQHSGPNTINIDGDQSGSWKGFEFDTCEVKIYGVNFSGLANDSISMLTMLDCPVIDIRGCSFDTETGSEKGVIDVEYSGSYGTSINDNVYISGNTFTTGNAEIPAVKVMAYSGITNPVIIEDNNFTGNNTAVFLSNIQGGAVKSNTFTDYGRSLTALSSSVDVFDNTVSSEGLYGLEALTGTELKMSWAGGMLVGGRNTITNSDTGSYNIYLEDSYFLMDEGENVFDIGPDSYHLYGWFPESYEGEYNETENCFKVQGNPVDPPNHYVTLGEQGYQITDFVFEPYLDGCMGGGGEGFMAINLGNGIYDTVLIMGSGGSIQGEYVISHKALYDSISISMRFRNYNNVKTLCTQLLNAYPDSAVSIGAVSKLYTATAKTDTSSQGITDLKTLYEGLILNHPNNITLVKRCNYYVQKCKVLLHQYSSALAGFQQIINQNQYNYLGLVARWDYMATSLLMQGQGGAVSSEKPYPWGVFEGDGDGDDNDKSPFTKKERKQIKQTVNTTLELSRTKEKKQIEVLTELSKNGDELATKQLKTKKALEQTVRTEKPKNFVEHMRIVTKDIKRVFVSPNSGKNKNNVFIPVEYNLSQNYPNPFNPKTKINYDIPKNSYVKLIVYDILGREVIRLVNNELKQPGRYTVEFNGTNFASGVYFFRLEARQAGSPTGDYVKARKMVLVK